MGKICTKCKNEYENISKYFSKDKHKSSGFHSNCNKCKTKSRKEPKLIIDINLMKVCKGCGMAKPHTLKHFNKHKFGKNGLNPRCKICVSNTNKSKTINTDSNILKLCSGCNVSFPATKTFFHQSIYHTYGVYSKCKKCVNSGKYRDKEQTRKQDRFRYHNNTDYKIKRLLRNRVYVAIEKGYKSKKTLDLLGCTIPQLKLYLEIQFKEDMTWDNYGNPKGDHSEGWHIDHIKPCAAFDLTDIEQQKECFHYTNLQPLWAKENLEKGDKYEANKLVK